MNDEERVIINEETAYVPVAESSPMELEDEEVKKSENEMKNLTTDNGQEIKTKSIGKKVLLIAFFIVLNVAVILGSALSENLGDNKTLSLVGILEVFKQNWIFVVLSILMLACYILFEAAKRYVFLLSTLKKPLPVISFNSALLCRYYDSVTPLGSGGQPFEIYYLRKKGIPVGIASGVPLMSYVTNRFSYVLITISVLAFYGFGEISTFLKVLCVLGLTANICVPLFIVLFAIMPKTAARIASLVAKIGKVFHIVKDEEEFKNGLIASMTEYCDFIKYFFKKSKLTMLMAMIFAILSQVALYSMPFFAAKMCGSATTNWWEMFSLCVICYTVVALLPTPGNSGGAEISFNTVFNKYLNSGTLFWGMLSWRMLSYYLVIVMGLILILIQQLYKLTKRGKEEAYNFDSPAYTTDIAVKVAAQAHVIDADNVAAEEVQSFSADIEEKTHDSAVIFAENPEIILPEGDAETTIEFAGVIVSEEVKLETLNISESTSTVEDNQTDLIADDVSVDTSTNDNTGWNFNWFDSESEDTLTNNNVSKSENVLTNNNVDESENALTNNIDESADNSTNNRVDDIYGTDEDDFISKR